LKGKWIRVIIMEVVSLFALAKLDIKLREWDKPLLELFLKKLETYNSDEVASVLKQKRGITLCRGVSYGWDLWLVASIVEDAEGHEWIDISLWKGIKRECSKHKVVEDTFIEINEIAETLETAKKFLKELISAKLPDVPYIMEELQK